MLFPTLYNERTLFDDFDNDFFMPMTRHDRVFGKNASRIMRTDVRETDTNYELDIDLPGFKKEEISAVLKDGNLTIAAQKRYDREQKQENGRYLRRERMSGACSRSFYVGDAVTEADIKAKFEDGILKISIPKKDAAQPVQKAIAIE